MRINKVFVSGLILFDPYLTNSSMYHYNMIGFITGKDKANIVKVCFVGTDAIQFCRQFRAHDLIHIEGILENAKTPKKETNKAYIAPVIKVEKFYKMDEQERREFIDVDFPKSVTKLFADIGQKYDPYFVKNGGKTERGGGNLQ